jgi:hypothetical protein
METLTDALFSTNLIAWVIVLVLVVLCLKLLHAVGKALLALIAVALLVFVLFQFFPDFVQPLVDWLGDGWGEEPHAASAADDLQVDAAEQLSESLTDWAVQTVLGAKQSGAAP